MVSFSQLPAVQKDTFMVQLSFYALPLPLPADQNLFYALSLHFPQRMICMEEPLPYVIVQTDICLNKLF